MSEKFDPYHEWLGIPPDEQPPNYYRLLGIRPLETSAGAIENAANQRMGHLRTFQTGRHAAESQQLLNEVAAARVCLLRPEKKAAYDQDLRKRLTPKVTPPVAEAMDSGLAEIFQTPPTSGASAIEKRRGKKQSQSIMPLLVAGAAVAAAIALLLGLWIYFSGSDVPNERAAADSDATKAGSSAARPAGSEPRPAKTRPSASAGSAASPIRPAPTPRGTITPPVPESAPKMEAPIATKPPSDSSSDGQSPPDEETTPAKRTPPSAEQQKKLIAEIDEIYDSNAIKEPAARAALARKLLLEGRTQSADANERFVLLRRAGELASDAGDPDLVVEAVDAIAAAGFDIQSLRVKARLLTRMLQQSPPGGEQLSAMCEACTRFAEDAAAQEATDDALDVLEAARKAFAESVRRAQAANLAARAAVARTRDAAERADRMKKAAEAESDLETAKAAQAEIAERIKNVQQTVHQLQAINAAREKLKTLPDDPAACLTIGRWRCFHEGEWSDGLKFLAKGSDLALKSLATDDLASQAPAADQRVARGDAWWDAAEKATGDDKSGMLRRAEYWYSEALPDLSGLLQTKVDKRLESLAKEAAPAPTANVAPAAHNTVLAKTKSVGGQRKKEFAESKADAMLIGLTVTIGNYSAGHTVVGSVRAIYQRGQGQVSGGRHGEAHGNAVTLLAKSGYAVGGIKAVGSDCLDGFRIVFMRVKGRQLDPTETYESDWVGGKEIGEETRLGCDGNPVVGIFGRKFVNVVAMGLIQLVPGPGRPQPRGAAVTVVYAQWGQNQTWVNVTKRIQELVDAGEDFVVNTESMKSDPSPGTLKHLKVVFRKNEKETTFWLDENGTIKQDRFQ